LPPYQPVRGALMVTCGALMFASMGVTVKLTSADLPVAMVVFCRNFFGLLALVPWLFKQGAPSLRTANLRLHLLRACAGLSAMYLFFYAISKLPLAEAVLLNFSAPLFIPIVAFLWLNERVARRVLWAIGVGFVGVGCILRPGMGGLSPAAWVGFASGAMAAVALTGVRRMAGFEPATRIIFYFSVLATTVSAVPLCWTWTWPPAGLWWLLVASGMFATAGQFFITRGYSYAPAAQVGPFHYTAVVFSALYGWLLWAEKPDGWTVVGAALICVAGILATHRGAVPPAPMYTVSGERGGGV